MEQDFTLYDTTKMPLLKADKKKLAKQYVSHLDGARNVVVLSYTAVPVNQMNSLRMELDATEWKLEAVKKRVLLKGIEGSYEGVTLQDMQGSIVLLYSYNEEDQHAPLKVIQRFKKQWKKEKLKCEIDYVGWWYDKEWKDKEYVGELADLPSKEELVWKFLFLLNHPVSSFARALQAIADAQWDWQGGWQEDSQQEWESAAPEAVAEESTSEETSTANEEVEVVSEEQPVAEEQSQ